MKKKVKKQVSTDDLAIMIAKGFENTVTRSEFTEHRKEFTGLSAKVDTLDQNIKATRRDVLEIGDRFVPRNEFDRLLIRFNNLEKKLKIKS